jgi:hypothetical protein
MSPTVPSKLVALMLTRLAPSTSGAHTISAFVNPNVVTNSTPQPYACVCLQVEGGATSVVQRKAKAPKPPPAPVSGTMLSEAAVQPRLSPNHPCVLACGHINRTEWRSCMPSGIWRQPHLYVQPVRQSCSWTAPSSLQPGVMCPAGPCSRAPQQASSSPQQQSRAGARQPTTPTSSEATQPRQPPSPAAAGCDAQTVSIHSCAPCDCIVALLQ